MAQDVSAFSGVKIKKARKRAKLSQTELGELIGVSKQAISKFENDQCQPSLNTYIELQRALRERRRRLAARAENNSENMSTSG